MKTLLPSFLLACVTIVASAQDSKKYQKIKTEIDDQDEDANGTPEQYNDWKSKPGYHGYHEGYVIDSAGNKIEGIIKSVRNSVKLVKPSGKTTKYLPDQCREYGYEFDRFASTGSSFMQIVYDLKSIAVYKKDALVSKGSMVAPGGQGGGTVMVNRTEREIIYYIRKKSEKKFEVVNKKNFAKKFSLYFSDCPYLNQNIKNKTLGSEENDLTAIAAIYDRECAPANK